MGHYRPLFLVSVLKYVTDIVISVLIMSFLVIITSLITFIILIIIKDASLILDTYSQSSLHLYTGFVEAHHHLMINAISKLVSDVKSIIQTCYEDRDKPRFVQLCEKLDLTAKVLFMFVYK